MLTFYYTVGENIAYGREEKRKNQPYNHLFLYGSISAVASIFTSTYVGVTLLYVCLLPVGHKTCETPRKAVCVSTTYFAAIIYK